MKNKFMALLMLFGTGCQCVAPEDVNSFQTPPDEIIALEPGMESVPDADYIAVLTRTENGVLRIGYDQKSRTPTEKEEEALEEAIKYWNKAFGKTYLVRDDENPNTLIEFTDLIQDRGTTFPKSWGRANTWIFQGKEDKYARCNIQIRNGVSESWSIYTHELGHCLGIGHSKSPESIMYGHCLNPNGKIVQESLQLREQLTLQK
jgi:predicted Zn-dependent protease